MKPSQNAPITPLGLLNASDQSVARDLLAALSNECFCDLQLTGRDDASVPAIRFVLAARSNVLRKMLFGDFCESKQPSIRLSYCQDTLSAIVHFCSFNVIPPKLYLPQEHHPANEGDLIDNIQLFVELFQAADFLELPLLGDLAQDYVTNQMTKYPSLACIVLEASTMDSSLAQLASQIIECRPYMALNPDIAYLSSEKVKRVLQNNAIGAGEWFLLQMLQLWHKEQQHTTGRLLNNTTRDICQSCIKLSYIEPALLLSLQDSSSWIPKDFIFDAIAKQALKASQFKVWRLECRGRNVNDDRVLVEGAGSPEVNGMYYRLSSSLSYAGKNSNDLYVKRELAGGQSFVYTLSRRLQSAGTTTTGGSSEVLVPPTKKYECRIFRNKFLTHQAVRKLHTMQLEGIVQNSFQPIMQILHIEGPDETDTAVPTPIRKFHRVRLSDGDCCMPGTLSDNHINLEKLTNHQVIQVQEFGLYTIYDCVGIHVIRAKVRASGPLFRFGNPQPMPPLDNHNHTNNNNGPTTSDNNRNADPDPTGQSDHATFYTAVYHDTPTTVPFTRIPKVGWCSEGSGVDPPPECTYIAVRDEHNTGTEGSSLVLDLT